jgi:sialate O-acetylesterase
MMKSLRMFLTAPVLRILFLACGAGLSFPLPPVSGEITMPDIFGDHMVLQQGTKLPVWGFAAPSEKVTVSFASQTATTTADREGNWRVDLAPVPLNGAGAAPQTMTIAGSNTITLQDVLVGDVWIASGQSNMNFGMNLLENAPAEIAKANEPQLRLFYVPIQTGLIPQKYIGAYPLGAPYAKWQVCTPQSVAQDGFDGFSAVGYYFGRALQQAVGHPVGIIGTYWGGTSAQAWTSLKGLQSDPALAHYVTEYQKIAANQIAPPADNTGSPTSFYNGMVAPLRPYAIKGVAWYQGESNTGTVGMGEEYHTLLEVLIKDWRDKWNEGDFPFVYVQLASFGNPAQTPSEGLWPYLRESQAKTLEVPHTGMAVAIDLGNPASIHPKDKSDVGARLALAARHVAYGEDVVYSGPTYDSMQVDGNKITISFKNVGSGLKIAAPPWKPDGAAIATPTELTGFGIAGADRNWVWAQATIDGNKVIVSSDKVPAPVAVRYGWADTPPVDLYNKEGLPASPFRTDNWD